GRRGGAAGTMGSGVRRQPAGRDAGCAGARQPALPARPPTDRARRQCVARSRTRGAVGAAQSIAAHAAVTASRTSINSTARTDISTGATGWPVVLSRNAISRFWNGILLLFGHV